MSMDLQSAQDDLASAIQAISLGSVGSVVIQEAGKAQIQNWNDHHDTEIDAPLERQRWETRPFCF